MNWKAKTWKYNSSLSGAYSRTFENNDRLLKVCVVNHRKDPNEAEAYVIITDFGPYATVQPHQVYLAKHFNCVPKEKVETEIRMQKAIARECTKVHRKCVVPIIYNSDLLENVDPRQLGFHLYYVVEGSPGKKGYTPIEDTSRVFTEVTNATLYLIEMEKLQDVYTRLSSTFSKKQKQQEVLNKVLPLYARSLILLLADLGFLHNDYHLGNFMIDGTFAKTELYEIKCYVIDFGNARRLSTSEREEYESLVEEGDKMVFIYDKAPAVLKKKKDNIYKWLWQKNESDAVNEITVDEDDFVPLDTLLEHMPNTALRETYSKTATTLCRTVTVVKV